MKRVRIVSYAINGRGMGHLVRQLAILRWVRRIAALLDVKCECWMLTSSEADTLARREGICAFKMPSKAMMRDAGVEPARYLAVARTWVLNAIAGLQPDLLLVDTFPGGSFGELVAALELAPRRALVARRVRAEFADDDAYTALLPLYDKHIVPDERGTGPIMIRERCELHSRASARQALGVEGDRRTVYVTLGGGGDVAAERALPRLVDHLRERDWHVVVGAGPLYQGDERRGERITWLDRYVPMELFPGFDAAVSAGGYNAYHELMYAGVPTVFLPQPRIADDQHERAERAQTAGAGRVASRLEDVPDLLDAPGDPRAALDLVPANGARAAAIEVLTTLLPDEDVRGAAAVLTPDMLGALHRIADDVDVAQAYALARLLAGGTPDQLRRRRAALAELADRGHAIPDSDESIADPGPRLARILTVADDVGAPLDTAIALVRSLHRKFPAASPGALVEAVELLFPAWARFDDWMGAVSLMRAVPTQRGYALPRFAAQLSAWLEGEDDLFDALRRFSRLEGGGSRTVAEVLRMLRHDGTSSSLESARGR